MKALILEADKTLVYKDVPEPTPRSSSEVLIRVTDAGICGSDLHRGFEGGAYHYPLIMGHEFAGVVEKPGDSGRFGKGQRITVFPLLPCRKCAACQTGDFAQCSSYDYFGSRRDGAFAEYLWAPPENIFPVPEHVESVHASMTEPCAVALHGVRKLNIVPGLSAVVFGGGPIGLMAAQWLRVNGCAKIFVVEVDERKNRIAADMDFIGINPLEKDPVTALQEATGGRGADLAIEACGLPLTFLQAVQSAAQFGQVLFMGNIRGTFQIGPQDFSGILRKELRILGTWNSKVTPVGNDDWSTALAFMDKQIQLAPLISHTPSLADGAEVFQRIVERSEYFNKVVFKI